MASKYYFAHIYIFLFVFGHERDARASGGKKNVNFAHFSPFLETAVLVAQLKYTKNCIVEEYFVNLFMQGKKNFTPQLFVSVNLLDLVTADNFYRKLLTELDLHFIYKATQK